MLGFRATPLLLLLSGFLDFCFSDQSAAELAASGETTASTPELVVITWPKIMILLKCFLKSNLDLCFRRSLYAIATVRQELHLLPAMGSSCVVLVGSRIGDDRVEPI